ncbi:unannotated protein [freshwater metagenome]|jgi:hypothetical protein|uniref:Unannotated protein n=1 Tax=freshwater metagenome TaxID=449393 RepID=A0A6J7J4W3_9ZZZZ|nr:heme biosynthesis protein HemY [Actinomycetota bacterium]MSW36491.1 heme biosynthesis protein HemY [Actinomycetota bacterium]
MPDPQADLEPDSDLDTGRIRAERYGHLPEHVALADTTTAQVSGPAPDPTMGRDIERDIALHKVGG